MDAQAAAFAAHEKIMATLRPPEALADVVSPGSLASLLAPAAWEPLREARRAHTAKTQELAEVSGALSRVEQELYAAEARVPRDTAALAAAYLAGSPTPEAPAPAKAPDRLHLTAVRDGLRQKRQELEAEVSWLEGRCRAVEADTLTAALRTAAERYADLVQKEVAPLHLQIEAAAQLLTPTQRAPLIGSAWRGETFLAPPLTDKRRLLPASFGGDDTLARFDTGAGLAGALEGWRRAVKAATGGSSL